MNHATILGVATCFSVSGFPAFRRLDCIRAVPKLGGAVLYVYVCTLAALRAGMQAFIMPATTEPASYGIHIFR